MTSSTKCGFGWLMFLTQVLLFGVTALVIYWTLEYRNGFGWNDDPFKQFNWHPVLMIVGFIFCMGQSMLIYRNCCCCKKTYAKLLHTLLHLLAMPAIAVSVVAVFEMHRKKNFPDLYSLHSWIGLGTLGLFALQFVCGFFTYLVFLCCDKSTTDFRAKMMPYHVHFGLATFCMAVASCVTGLTEKAIFSLDGKQGRDRYSSMPDEGLVINVIGVTLVVLAVLVTYIIRNQSFKRVTVLSMN